MKKNNTLIGIRDYLLVSLIAVSFSIFTIPILKNIKIIEITPVVILGEIVFFLIAANFAIWIASEIAKKIPVILQIAKFVAVGVFNTFFNWGIVNFLMFITNTFKGKFYTLFIVIAFIFANLASFFWNKQWVFLKNAKKQDSTEKDYAQFLIVSLFGLLIQAGISTGWVEFVPTTQSDAVWANIGLILGTVF